MNIFLNTNKIIYVSSSSSTYRTPKSNFSVYGTPKSNFSVYETPQNIKLSDNEIGIFDLNNFNLKEPNQNNDQFKKYLIICVIAVAIILALLFFLLKKKNITNNKIKTGIVT